MVICLFVCLFVGINPEKLYSSSFSWREVNPLGVITHRHRHSLRACDKDSGTDHVRVNQWLTLYKLTGWLASLDLRKPHTRRILSHRTASPHALFGVLVLDRGRGKTMSDCLFVCLFVCWYKTRKTILRLLCLSFFCLFVCSLVRLFAGNFIQKRTFIQLVTSYWLVSKHTKQTKQASPSTCRVLISV